MMGGGASEPRGPLAVIQRILQDPQGAATGEACELCGAAIDRHSHVVDIEHRSLLCSCRPCALLFEPEGAAGGRYRTVPDRTLSFRSFAMDEQLWDRLQIPVSMAFFFRNSQLDRTVAFYPSPGGATESEMPLQDWALVERANPAVKLLVPDVEALLVRRRKSGFDCYLVPIDACYELVGHLRLEWRGFDGGQQVRRRIEDFFDHVHARARPAGEALGP